MANITTTARGTANVEAKRLVVDMSDKISLLQPDAAPLLVLTKKISTKPCSNYKFEWMEDDIMGVWTTFTGTTESTPGTTLAVGDSSIFAVGDLIKVPRTSEVIKVLTIASGTSITVTRGYGETSSANLTNADKIMLIGNASMQGSGAPAEKYNKETPLYNYTQIFKTAFSATNTLEAIEHYGPKTLAYLRKKRGIEHSRQIENALLFGEKKLDTSGEQPLSTTAGVIKFLQGTTNATSNTSANITETAMVDWCEDLFTYGSKQKVFLCGGPWLTKVDTWAKGKMQVENGASTFGLKVFRYITPHGDLLLIRHPLFVQAYAGYGIALDMDEISYRPLRGRDTKFMTNVQNHDEDGERDLYITEAGLELRSPKKHGMYIITDAS